MTISAEALLKTAGQILELQGVSEEDKAKALAGAVKVWLQVGQTSDQGDDEVGKLREALRGRLGKFGLSCIRGEGTVRDLADERTDGFLDLFYVWLTEGRILEE